MATTPLAAPPAMPKPMCDWTDRAEVEAFARAQGAGFTVTTTPTGYCVILTNKEPLLLAGREVMART